MEARQPPANALANSAPRHAKGRRKKRVLRSLAAIAALAFLTAQIVVATPPSGDFTISDTVPDAGDPVTFEAIGLTDLDGGTPTGISWDFGDGGSDTGVLTSHSYGDPGPVTVTMTIADPEGVPEEATVVQHTLRVNAPPTASVSCSPASPAPGEAIECDGSGSGDSEGSVSYAWDKDGDGFDDGTASSAQFSYPTSGTKTIRLQVTDTDGATDTAQQSVTVTNSPPNASFSCSPATIAPNQATVCNGSASSDPEGAISTYEWDVDGDGFNDGNGVSRQFTFTTAGTKTIALRVTDSDGATDTAQQNVRVNAPPSASVSCSPAVLALSQATMCNGSASSDPEGAIATYEWDVDGDGFDDGTGATRQFTFTSPGTRTISLRVTDSDSATDVAQQNVRVNAPPNASFTCSPAVVMPSQATTCNAGASSDAEGAISTYEWDVDGDGFDDGNGSSRQFTFTNSGNQTITLRVTDSDGATDTAQQNVRVNSPPSASVSCSPTVLAPNQLTTCDGSASGDAEGALTYDWDVDGDGFDDGPGASRQFSFPTPGQKTIRLRVTDSDGATATATQNVRVNAAPIASFSCSPTVVLPSQATTCNAGASSDVEGQLTYAWDADGDGFDDGNAVSGQFSYPTAGVKAITLRVTDSDGATDTAQQTVRVNSLPNAVISCSPAVVLPNQATTCNGGASTDTEGALSYHWDSDGDGFDDGTGSSRQFSFPTAGNQTITLRVTDSDGATDTATQDVRVNAPPSASVNCSPAVVLPNQATTCNGSASSDTEGALTYEWDSDGDGFDDGTGSSRQFSFPTAGIKTIALRVTDSDGATAVAQQNVRVNAPPTASFTCSPAVVLPNQATTCNGSASSDAEGLPLSSFEWDADGDGFDDGNGSSRQFSFPTAGIKTITLRVTDSDGATATTTRNVRVNAPPTASFTCAPAVVLPNQATTCNAGASNDAEGALTYDWDSDGDGQFDDGTGSSRQFSFPTVGTKTIRLRVTDSDGATATATQTVRVNAPPNASFTCSPTVVLPSQATTCNAGASSDTEGALTYEWDSDGDGFDDGNAVSGQFSYPTAGVKTITLRVTDSDGAIATAQQSVRVNAPPIASFTCSPAVVLPNQATMCNAGASSDAEGQVTYAWDSDGDGFDDGTTSTRQFSFPTAGVKTITLRVTDSDGATATATQTVRVNAPPTASFSCAPAVVLPTQATTCNAGASSDAEGQLTFAWDADGDGFNDGGGSSRQFSYPTAGVKTITLRVTDSDGATATATQSVRVNAPPIPSFSCSPAVVLPNQATTCNGTASSDAEGTVTYAWDSDGDGFNNGSDPTEQFSFATPGTKTIALRVTDSDGATQSTQQTVEVGDAGPTAGITVTPSSPAVHQTVVFDGTASQDPEGGTLAFAWDFDNDGFDDAVGNSKPSHVFTTAGAKTVRLLVVDPEGNSDEATRIVTVTNTAPTASFTITPGTARVEQLIALDGRASSDPERAIAEADHKWDLDNDGSFDDATGRVTAHRFSTPGTKTIGLQVSDGALTHSATRTVTITNEAPTASITSITGAGAITPAVPDVGETVTFAGSATDPDAPIKRLEWDFEYTGGTFTVDATVTGTGPPHATASYSSAGPRTVALRAIDSADLPSQVVTQSLRVNGKPIAAVVAKAVMPTPNPNPDQKPDTANIGQPLDLDATGSTDPNGPGAQDDQQIPGAGYIWDFNGDGQFGDDNGEVTGGSCSSIQTSKPRCTFTTTGPRTFALQVVDPDGTFSEPKSVTFQVNTPPQATITSITGAGAITPAVPDVGETVTFVGSATDHPDGQPIKRLEWDFDYTGGTFTVDATVNGTGPPHATTSYSSAGPRTVALRAVDAADVRSAVVVTPPAQPLRINGKPIAAVVPGAVMPTPNPNPEQKPDTPIIGQPLDLDATGSTDPNGPGAQDDQQVPGPGYIWDFNGDGRFGDDNAAITGGSCSSIQTSKPRCTFTTAGTRTFALQVVDPDGAFSEPKSVSFRVNTPPEANFFWTPATPVVHDRITFRQAALDRDGEPLTYEWDLNGDGDFESQGPTAEHIFDTASTEPGHPVRLQVTDSGGATHVVTTPVPVPNTIPRGRFTWSPGSPLPGQTVTFSGSASEATAGKQITGYEWDFDYDPIKDPAAQFEEGVQGESASRAFETPGAKTVALKVTETDGGVGIVFDTIVVNAPPRANFSISDESPYAGDPVTISSTASDPDGPLASQQWDLDGDGQFNDASGPVLSATFAQPGSYTVRLRVTDSKDAIATAFRDVTVRVKPVPPPRPPELLPGVLVEIKGSLLGSDTLVKRLFARAPAGSKVTVLCRGKSCPKKTRKQTKRVRSKGLVRFKRLERKLRPGTKIVVQITRSGYVGRQTTFTMRRGTAPKRVDLCLPPGAKKAVSC